MLSARFLFFSYMSSFDLDNTVILLNHIDEQWEKWCNIADLYFGLDGYKVQRRKDRAFSFEHPCVRTDKIGSSNITYYEREGFDVIYFSELLEMIKEGIIKSSEKQARDKRMEDHNGTKVISLNVKRFVNL